MSSKETFSAGQTREFYGDGDFFRLLQTTAGINVEFYYQGREIAEMIDIEAGYAESFARDKLRFDRIRIYSATAQDVKWVIREGSDVRYDRGAASITGVVALDAATLAVLDRNDAATASYKAVTALAANTAEVVFTAAANINGAIVLTAQSAYWDNTTNGIEAFVAKATAPANIIDGEPILLAGPQAGASATISSGTLPEAQFIPAGVGLYFISNRALIVTGVAATCSARTCRYKLL